jgi:hypothetical protein
VSKAWAAGVEPPMIVILAVPVDDRIVNILPPTMVTDDGGVKVILTSLAG